VLEIIEEKESFNPSAKTDPGKTTNRKLETMRMPAFHRVLLFGFVLLVTGNLSCSGQNPFVRKTDGTSPGTGRVTKGRKENPYFSFIKGYNLALQGELDAAAKAYQQAVASDPSSDYLHLSLAKLYLQLGDPEKALEGAKAAVALDPDNLDAHLLLAGIYSATRKIPDAIEAYKQVLEINPDMDRPRLFLSSLYAATGQFDEAVEN